MFTRDQTRRVDVGGVAVGGGTPVAVQSMAKTDTRDADATLAQIRRLAAARCRFVRVAVPDEAAAEALPRIVDGSPVPIVADIHFKHTLAIAAVRAGVAGLRINPGTIGKQHRVAEVVAACKERGIPIRVGVNAGSLPKPLLEKHGGPAAGAMVDAALGQVALLRGLDFHDIKVSLKASDAERTADACLAFAEASDLPQHIGVTEAGSPLTGAVKSAVGLSRVLSAGIGDTIRVSLAGDPVLEVRVAYAILRAVGLSPGGIEVIACPTCGRIEGETMGLVAALEEATAHLEGSATLAVMGCSVNGPGESREADIGLVVAGGNAYSLYRAGRYVKKIDRRDAVRVALDELDAFLAGNEVGGA